MWIRLRLDIGWGELGRGFVAAFWPGGDPSPRQALESFWSQGQDDALACLCVRSGFDLLLEALRLPEGSEVLFSAITLPDMPLIAASHGLTPVPVDLRGDSFHLDTESLRKAISPSSKMLVVAHLFGERPEMAEILAIAREHDLLVVEDCAQAWHRLDWRGHPLADVSLFSFGTIKTATALGGGLCRVRDRALLGRMRELLVQQPVQSWRGYLYGIGKCAVLKALSSRPVCGCAAFLARIFGGSLDELLGGLTRGFPKGDLLARLRRRPCAPLLRMLHDRLRTYNDERVRQRIRYAHRFLKNLCPTEPLSDAPAPEHSYWVFPYTTDQPDQLIACLRENGFDAAQRGRMRVVPPPPDRPELVCPNAHSLLDRSVFLPCYPEFTERAIDQLCDQIWRWQRRRIG